MRPGAKTSMILCSKDGGERLLVCLDHLGRLVGPDDLEIILVDNGSTDDTSLACASAFTESSRFRCRLLQCTTPGNGAARNRAIDHATGDLLLFIDADCYVEPDFVTNWLAVFSMSDVGYASGRIMRFHPEHSMLGCKESRSEELIAARSFVRRGFIQGSNMAFRRTCLDEIEGGYFDERFGSGTPFAGEEWELALRASAAGFAGGYFAAPGVAHDHQRSGPAARARLLFYDYGAGAVYGKHLLDRENPRIAGEFLGEIRRLRDDRTRLGRLLKGFVDYHLHQARRAAREALFLPWYISQFWR